MRQKKKKRFFLNQLKKKSLKKIFLNWKKVFFKFIEYYDYDDTEYKEIRDVGNLFNLTIDEDYYKPIKTNNVF